MEDLVMRISCRLAAVAGFLVLHAATDSMGQVRRYEPSRPTVSPYINLFREDLRSPLPNYYTFVRPLQQQYQINQTQQRMLMNQNQAIGQLQSNVQDIERRQIQGPLVAPTGKGSWFSQGGRSRFRNTSTYYSRGPVGAR
jgi:hypothetical protein